MHIKNTHKKHTKNALKNALKKCLYNTSTMHIKYIQIHKSRQIHANNRNE